jgi:hypothetical protein
MSPNLGIIASSISGHLFTLVGNYDALGTVTVPSGGLSTITFAGIPSTYTHLQIRAFVKTNRGTYGRDEFSLQFNSDTASNYSWHTLYGDGGTALAYGIGSDTKIDAGYIAGGAGTSMFGAGVVDILDYANTNKYKTIRSLTGHDHNGVIAGIHAIVNLNSGSWRSTNAINSITIGVISGTAFNEYSEFALYGVKA